MYTPEIIKIKKKNMKKHDHRRSGWCRIISAVMPKTSRKKVRKLGKLHNMQKYRKVR